MLQVNFSGSWEDTATGAIGPSGPKGSAGNALWSPLGWPNSRTAAFQEQRTESDQSLGIGERGRENVEFFESNLLSW